jgi:hypothetical protein
MRRIRAVYKRRDAMSWPEQAREPAPNEKCWMPALTFSDAGSIVPLELSHRSGLKVAASGPKWSISNEN